MPYILFLSADSHIGLFSGSEVVSTVSEWCEWEMVRTGDNC